MKKVLLGLVLIIVVIAIILFIPSEPCSEFTDSSQRANCFASLGEVSYCAEEAYYFDTCLDSVDPLREASMSDLEEVCEAVTDTSRREDCYEYLSENY